jgi:hypothetical protein
MGDNAYGGEPVSLKPCTTRYTRQQSFRRLPILNETSICKPLLNHVELAIQRYKRIFGNAMKARALAATAKIEAWIAARPHSKE